MRIAILANPGNIHVQRWVRFLVRRGHEILIVADPHAPEKLPGVTTLQPRWNLLTNILAFRLTPRPHGNALWKFLHYRTLIRSFKPDVVHGFEAYYSGLATAWAGPYPKVLTPWGKDVHHDAANGPLWNWIIKTSLRGADRITTNDETLSRFLHERFGIPEEKVRTFSWGIDLSVFNRGHELNATRWRPKLRIPSDAPVVFNPRKMHPYWGAPLVLEAMSEILKAHPKAVLVQLAYDDEAGILRQQKARAEQLGIAASIRWIELWLDPAQMAELFNLSQVFMSAPENDLLAMTVLEGMACGAMPVVADLPAYAPHLRQRTDAGGENAIVLNGRTAAEIARAVVFVLDHPEARRAAADFNIRRMALLEDAEINMRKIEEVYAEAALARQTSSRIR